MKQIRLYQIPQGKAPYLVWLNKIKDKTTKARIIRRIDRLYFGNEGDFRSVGNGVYELKIPLGPGYRVYYGKYKNGFILLLGGAKNTQASDIKLAKLYWQNLQQGEYHES